MNNVVRKVILPVVLLALFLTGCEFSASTANIQEAVLARDEAGTAVTTAFDPTDTVYSLVELANAPDSTKLKAVWTAVDVGDAAPANQLIDETELEAGSGTHQFSLTPDVAFPPGSYKVDIYLDDALDRTLTFTVNGEVAQAPAAEPTASSEETADGGSETAGSETAVEPSSPGGAISSLETVKDATIRIEAQGSFVNPEDFQQVTFAGQGTGFIIDPSGIAVTNNHVVTGSAFLQVYIDGEENPRNARILGVSECSDLAVIDIDGDGYPYLAWYDGNVDVGLDMYLAGYPLAGNEEYTLNRGIISKAAANGETPWSSVDAVLEYDATSNGGNSGGPVVTSDGKVIAVHYAGNREARQAFGISSAIAQNVVARLRAGEDVNAIGINGQAFLNPEAGLAGIWVASVASGSPADAAGIRGGDIITHLEGLQLATDGTMADYCDILRSRNPEDTMSVQVLRFATGEVLEGQINGRALEVVSTMSQAVGDEVAQGESYGEYVTITDNSGALSVSVPATWSDVDGSGWTVEGETIGAGLSAAPDLSGFNGTWSTPGMFFGASTSLVQEMNEQAILDAIDYSDSCTYDGRFDYADQLYTGYYDQYSNCGGQGTLFIVLSAAPQDRSFITLVMVQALTSADVEALDNILNSFVVVQ